jgi:uncharacterized protein (TIGR02145 family)
MKNMFSSAFCIIIFCTIGFAQKPCPGIPSLKYGGKIYHTVQIGSQCWLKENLDVGVMIDSAKSQTNNGVIEKYCYRNNPANCTKLGGLYQWNEALQYSSDTIKVQGICPKDWHLPDTSEISKLILAVNKNSKKLKAIGQGDGAGVGTNNSGFSALLAGSRGLNGAFFGLNGYTYIWVSTVANSSDAFDLYLNHGTGNIYQSNSNEDYGFSVRCIKN